MGRVLLCGSKQCKEEGEEKCEETWALIESVAIPCTPLTQFL